MSSKPSNCRLEKGKMQFVSTSVASSNQTNAANTRPQQELPGLLVRPSLSASFPVEHGYTRDQLLYFGGELPYSISNRIIAATFNSPSFHFNPSLFCKGHVPFDEGIENGSTSDISGVDITNTTDIVLKEIPNLILPEKILNKIRKPWEKNALILNVLGERVCHKTFCAEVGDLWEFKKDFKVIELGYNFYIIWFESMEDYMKVFCGGPCAILGHYLGVRKWEPNFRAWEAKEIATARVWIRFHRLPIEYYDKEALQIIADRFGKPIKIDVTIDEETRARSARVCVEIDQRKPRCHEFRLERDTYEQKKPKGFGFSKRKRKKKLSSKPSNRHLEEGKMQFVSTSVASSNQTNTENTGPQQELLQPSLSASFPVEHRYTRDQLLYLGGELPNSISNRIIKAAINSPSFHFDPSLFCIAHVPIDEGIEKGSTSDISSTDITNTTDIVLKEIPNLILSEKILNQIRKPWEKNALIFNVLGERVEHRTFCAEVGDLWEFKKDFKVIELGYNFYIIWFESMEDYMKVFCGGPWAILGHYLGVRKWEPNFRAWEAKEIATARVWIRFPSLPIEYYDEEALRIIAERFGKPIKIDVTIDEETRARSARVCVEIDLKKPRCREFQLEGDKYKVEYDSTHSFCFNCGRVGHRNKNCESHSTVRNPERDLRRRDLTFL
ncbi:hypothetical protein RHSIM_Rhsim10G0082700 [Rhododendron simsii]|uniref:CCHC-type domain-containing protein n=1 Tax=Rhododendron simsii TaxID=118357 RepID=A0A834GBZ3_RHOSS|nr:hypothetical protein RHSIM_Rhsim10G0082700 [Rhododendron simsii]